MRFSSASFTAYAIATSIPLALAQTSTDCNPTEKTCPNDVGLNSKTFTSDFTSAGANASWSAAANTNIKYGSQGAEFSISSKTDAPTLQTDFYMFFGRVDVVMKASTGTGIVSSVVLESDDLDEIDWEWLGGDTTQAQTNFFGKGNTTSYDRGTYETVSTPQSTSHTYSIDWTSERIEWIIDGTTVRTLTYDDPLTLGGTNYPQTPMRVKLGSWCGGCSSSAGTVEWAGGKTSFDDAPYVMYIESIDITNNNPAEAYKYSDKTGSYKSIKLVNGGSSSSASSDSSASSTTSATGSSGSSGSSAKSTNTVAPTSSHSVAAVSENTAGVVQSKTTTGTGSSMSKAPTGYGNSTMAGTGTMATASATASSGSASGSGSSNQTSSSAASSIPVQSMNGASAAMVMTGGSLLSIALGYLVL